MLKSIVITGAGTGLGRALAHRFARNGFRIALLGRTRVRLEAVAAEIGDAVLPIVCDIGSPDAVRAAFATIAERFGRIDVLINNAAIFPFVRLIDASDDQILDTVAAGLVGPMLCSRAALPLMEHGAHILNVSSGAVERRLPALTIYTGTKAGLEGFSLNLVEELEPQGIRVTAVRTGQMVENLDAWDNDPAVAAASAAAAAHGVDSRSRPSSTFAAVADVMFGLTEYPGDVSLPILTLRPRRES